ncbi:MAG: hypothetical protein KJO04_12070 [Bacteroidia bacterium]|nr:hypothetical protein [Bacteroidia bacterium]
MSKIALIGIALISLLTYHDSTANDFGTASNSEIQFENIPMLAPSLEYQGVGGDCTVTTHGYIQIDGVAVYFTLSVNGPCDSSIADKVRAAIRALRGIK